MINFKTIKHFHSLNAHVICILTCASIILLTFSSLAVKYLMTKYETLLKNSNSFSLLYLHVCIHFFVSSELTVV